MVTRTRPILIRRKPRYSLSPPPKPRDRSPYACGVDLCRAPNLLGFDSCLRITVFVGLALPGIFRSLRNGLSEHLTLSLLYSLRSTAFINQVNNLQDWSTTCTLGVVADAAAPERSASRVAKWHRFLCCGVPDGIETRNRILFANERTAPLIPDTTFHEWLGRSQTTLGLAALARQPSGDIR
jgi:hypothetical protein